MTAIDQEHMKQVCQPGSETCCAYLVMGSESFECAKLTPLKYTIELKLAEGTMNATGDNCPGYGKEQS
jgi:hypothetical protein